MRFIIQLSILFIFLMSVLFSSCIPQNKILYLHEKQITGDELHVEKEEYRFRPGDMLYIDVMSNNPEINELFSLDDKNTWRSTSETIGDLNMYLYGYRINKGGIIQLPMIGQIEVAGYSLDQVIEIIQERMADYVTDFQITVRLINFKVTVLGEVNKPGLYYVYSEELTVMDAIGLAGDMTDYGRRKINIIRKTDEGNIHSQIDIRDWKTIESELFYLQPNDLIYVEPMLAKRFNLDRFPYSEIFSAISTIILLISFIQ